MKRLALRWLCLVIGHRFAPKYGPLDLADLFLIGTPAFFERTALHCERCGLDGTRPSVPLSAPARLWRKDSRLG